MINIIFSSYNYLWNKYLPIKYFENDRNMGLSFSLRRAINESVGELLLRIDLDDECESNHICEIMKLFEKKDAVLFSTRSQYLSSDSKIISTSKFLYDENMKIFS